MTEEEVKAAAEEKVRLEKLKLEEEKNKTITLEEHRKQIAEVVEERNLLKQKNKETRDKLKEVEERINALPSADQLTKLMTEKKELEEFKIKIEKEIEERKLKEATEVERLQMQMKKIQDGFDVQLKIKEEELTSKNKKTEEELQKKSAAAQKLLKYKKESELLKAAEKHGAFKPHQIVALLEGEFKLEEDTETFFYEEKDAKGKVKNELSIEDRVKQFLEDPENANLVKSDILSGSGSIQNQNAATTRGTGGAPGTAGSKYRRSEKDILAEEAAERGLDVKIWENLKKKQEEIKAKKKTTTTVGVATTA